MTENTTPENTTPENTTIDTDTLRVRYQELIDEAIYGELTAEVVNEALTGPGAPRVRDAIIFTIIQAGDAAIEGALAKADNEDVEAAFGRIKDHDPELKPLFAAVVPIIEEVMELDDLTDDARSHILSIMAAVGFWAKDMGFLVVASITSMALEKSEHSGHSFIGILIALAEAQMDEQNNAQKSDEEEEDSVDEQAENEALAAEES